MAIEAESFFQILTAGQRAVGMGQAAKVRAVHWPQKGEKELSRFVADMRDTRDIGYQHNRRVLAAIFFLANINRERHDLELSELTTDERSALIKAMIHVRAVVSLFPKSLTLPN